MTRPARQSRLSQRVIERVAESLATNPGWSAAARYAGVGERTLRGWRERAENYAKMREGDEQLADLAARRAFATARDEWANPATRAAGIARLARLDRYLDRHPDKPYYEANVVWLRARAECEHELIDLLWVAAHKGHWRAAWTLLKVGWPEQYSDRTELTGARGAPVQIDVDSIADKRASGRRIAAALEQGGIEFASLAGIINERLNGEAAQ